jgi:hypothetical protein
MRRCIAPVLSLLLVLTGCADMNNLRIVQDRPDDLQNLIGQHEFVRARLLTARYPAIDTLEVQHDISARESEYEESVYTRAGKLAAADNLLGAVNLLTEALQKLPHSVLLHTLRADLEVKREQQVKINERNILLTRAHFLLEQRKLYAEKTRLQRPDFLQKREASRQQQESGEIAGRLVDHAGYALQQSDTATAKTCLQLAQQLSPSERGGNLLAGLLKQEQAEQATRAQAALKKEAITRRDKTRSEKKETRQILEVTQQAIEQHKLQDAQAALARLPASSSKNSDVVELQSNLEQVVTTRVHNLILAGDSQYRAEHIQSALKAWNEALSLDPDNHEIIKRIDRANRVLANLEELRRQQK